MKYVSFRKKTEAKKLFSLTVLSYLFLLFFGTLHSDVNIIPFLLCFLLLFFHSYILEKCKSKPE